jgi:hypothetical protein
MELSGGKKVEIIKMRKELTPPEFTRKNDRGEVYINQQ